MSRRRKEPLVHPRELERDNPYSSIPATDDRSVVIAQADDDMIDGILLEWSGLRDLWDAYELYCSHTFLKDVLRDCEHQLFYGQGWDADMPGLSGTIYTVETDDPEALKRELWRGVSKLARASGRKPNLEEDW